ncbi:soluble inorganic pyrophosphatase 1, putative [Entamoeba invadens IP1]|uniref:inorganic diphosphatase n=1 Tax=Entamoeba invadens IP1 TaxID=370355 RepID=A0A0A1UBW9_ENTIV|nr:soluble inorganic pyrophosphatase 1, putative [Entamoeba invadens IP1]ELP92700.1 soluble inorganic pyrophosphatase 1, putative [Entamoeba invadens IP1]|eukprot:XP_004259471.1 soluble inorganic pyrophosphatase 1, putative [Entamoeba invadens IP1]
MSIVSLVPNFGTIRTHKEGAENAKSFRIYFEQDGKKISPWHKLPAFVDKNTVNMVCEIPRGTNAKMEINTTTRFNPIKQDLNKDGSLRFLKHGNVLNHYGAIPQTWEDLFEKDSIVGIPGDNDPVDIIDISSIKAARGEVTQIKPICALALLDGGETDWKVIGINVKDPNAMIINSAKDVEKIVDEVREWYRVYKVAEGKKLNKYAYGGKAFGQRETMDVINESHLQYRKLKMTQKKLAKLALD